MRDGVLALKRHIAGGPRRLHGLQSQKKKRGQSPDVSARHVPAIAASAVVLLSILLGFLARWQFLTRLARYAERRPGRRDTAVIASMRWPLPTWCLLGGVYAATRLVRIPPLLARTFEKVLLSVLIISVSFWVASLLGRLLELRGVGAGRVRAASGTGVVRTLVRVVVLAVGTLVLLSTLGISVTPLLTTMGLGGLAVAFGLRETLANLFAGMNFTLAGNINVGDFVKLGSGEGGRTVEGHRGHPVAGDAGEHAVRHDRRDLQQQLADSVVTNYHQPSPDALVSSRSPCTRPATSTTSSG